MHRRNNTRLLRSLLLARGSGNKPRCTIIPPLISTHCSTTFTPATTTTPRFTLRSATSGASSSVSHSREKETVDFSPKKPQQQHEGNDQEQQQQKQKRFTPKRILAIGIIVLVAFAALSEVNYYMMPELSFGNMWRKWIYGDPFRNYISMIRGRVLYMTLPTKYHIAETPAEMANHNSTTTTSKLSDDERIVFISVERGFHLIVPKHFVPLGLELKEQNSNIRGYGSITARDIIGNALSVEWQRAAPLFDKTQLSVYTPKQEALEHIAHYFLDQLNQVMDHVHVQRIEYIPAMAPPKRRSESSSSESTDVEQEDKRVKPLEPVPYFQEKKRPNDDMLIVVTKSQKGSNTGWQGHLFSMEYPYVYRFTIDMSNDVCQFGSEHSVDEHTGRIIVSEDELNKVATSYTKVESLHPIIRDNFAHAPADPSQIGRQLRNELLAMHFNSFHTIPSK